MQKNRPATFPTWTDKHTNVFTQNENLTYFIARKWSESSKYPFDECVSLCRVGLAKAVLTFDENRAIKFATYAVRIMNNEILMEFRKNKKHKSVMNLTSFCFTDKEGEEADPYDFLKPLSTEETFFFIEEEVLCDLLKKLDMRELQVINLIYFQDKKQSEIADILGITQSYISRIQKRAITKMKKEAARHYA